MHEIAEEYPHHSAAPTLPLFLNYFGKSFSGYYQLPMGAGN